MRRSAAMVIALVVASASTASAEIKTKVVDYTSGGAALQGFIAWDDASAAKRPGIVVVHEWWGHNDHARNSARRLAEAGYVGFALDMYGKGKLAAHPDDAMKFMTEATKDPAALAARFNAALAELKRDPHVDPTRVGAIGYCFGGTVVISQARLGADLDVVASFHGGLGGLPPVKPGAVKARVLVYTGAADPMIPSDQVEAFRKDMAAAGATVDIVTYPNAKHGFTNPAAGSFGMDALAYDAAADKDSWAAMVKGFKEVF
ncbi:MAG: dienelactone hydrolase family protein [Vicinamibacteria bacterium]|nr:dienelactone hydrolase family protein [Vicinamibacteria bacterium]